ncbi:MAG: ABC transporter permease [Oscillospiraceae bacterium]
MKSFLKLMTLSIQGKLYYKTSFVLNLLTPVVLLVGQYLLWGSLYGMQGGGDIGSMSRADMYSYILIAFAINNLLTWSSENALSREIRSGTVVSRCVRPVSFLSQSVSEMVGSQLLQGAVNFTVVILGFALFSRYLTLPSLQSVLLFIPCFVLGCLLRIMLVDIFSLLCFFTTGHLGISWTRRALFEFFSGAVIPVTLFPAWLRTVAYYTPFPYMLQAPTSILLGQELAVSLPLLFTLQVGWTVAFLLLHALLYGKIRKNLTVAGG